jgi:hypothetical protein
MLLRTECSGRLVNRVADIQVPYKVGHFFTAFGISTLKNSLVVQTLRPFHAACSQLLGYAGFI